MVAVDDYGALKHVYERLDDDRSGANNRRNFVRFRVVSQMRFATGMAIAVLRGAQ